MEEAKNQPTTIEEVATKIALMVQRIMGLRPDYTSRETYIRQFSYETTHTAMDIDAYYHERFKQMIERAKPKSGLATSDAAKSLFMGGWNEGVRAYQSNLLSELENGGTNEQD